MGRKTGCRRNEMALIEARLKNINKPPTHPVLASVYWLARLEEAIVDDDGVRVQEAYVMLGENLDKAHLRAEDGIRRSSSV